MTKDSASVAHCLDVEQIFHTLGPWLRPGQRSTPVVLETLLDTVLTQSWFQTLADLLMKGMSNQENFIKNGENVKINNKE